MSYDTPLISAIRPFPAQPFAIHTEGGVVTPAPALRVIVPKEEIRPKSKP